MKFLLGGGVFFFFLLGLYLLIKHIKAASLPKKKYMYKCMTSLFLYLLFWLHSKVVFGLFIKY